MAEMSQDLRLPIGLCVQVSEIHQRLLAFRHLLGALHVTGSSSSKAGEVGTLRGVALAWGAGGTRGAGVSSRSCLSLRPGTPWKSIFSIAGFPGLTWDPGGSHLASEANSRCTRVTFGSSFTFGTYGARGSLQTPLPWPSWLPHGACPTWKSIFSRRPWGSGSALRGLCVRRGHLGQEVGKFGFQLFLQFLLDEPPQDVHGWRLAP